MFVRGQIQNGHQTTGSEDKTAHNVGTKLCKNTCSTTLGMPINLVLLLITSELKDINLQLSHGQVML